jgi:arsenate reductase (glutaredoxin)
MTLTLYGIPNCDSMKKARQWLDSHGLAYSFHDYKKAGIDVATLQSWCREAGYTTLLNTRGTTWRKLDEAQRSNMDEARAVALMQQYPSLIKRPVLATGKQLLVGVDEPAWQTLL